MAIKATNKPVPNYVGLSTDIATTNGGVDYPGETIYLSDSNQLKIVNAAGTLVDYAPSGNSADYSIFGTLETAELEPSIQMDFVYGINSQTGVSTVSNGTVDTNGGRLRLQTTTNAAGSAIFRSRKVIRYRAGQGAVARFTAAFTAGKANSTQIVGVGTATNGYFFGYNGTSFGICHRNGGSDTWVAEADWNGADATWTKTNGIPLMIKYPYLGYGNIKFFIQDSITSNWVLVHTIRYANTTATTQLTNPNMYFYAQALNANNNTNLIVYVGSVGIFISGKRAFVGGPKWSMDATKASITTENNLLTLQNATSYNGVDNHTLVRIQSISVASSATTGVSAFRMKLGATVGGTVAFGAIDGTITTASGGLTLTTANSMVTYDTGGTTIAGGTMVFSLISDNPNTSLIDLEPYNIYIAPGERLSITAYSSNSATVGASVNWVED